MDDDALAGCLAVAVLSHVVIAGLDSVSAEKGPGQLGQPLRQQMQRAVRMT
jgi:hypothetical protein